MDTHLPLFIASTCMPSAARSKPFRPLQSVPRREKRLACEARSSTRKEREAKRRVSHATQREAHPSAARHADPPGVAAVVSVFPVVSRPDEHIGAALSRPCSAARRRRQATTITHTSHITHLVAAHYCCLPSPSIPLPSLLPFPPSEMPSPPLSRAYPCSAMRARAHAAITLRCVPGERDSTDHIQHTHITSHITSQGYSARRASGGHT